ncbi:ABC transporter permease [Christensenellaceae bacterium OttesenSCG-928-K19]|nr:ABC transporter permease [Christensenellaceae bacterium OttesenSCG-928-K19]
MNHKKLTVFTLAFENIKRNRFRSVWLVILVAVFAFAIFCGTVLTGSLDNGIKTMAGRVGADLMVVAQGYEVDLEDTLLRSEPSTFYLDGEVLEGVRGIAGVEEASSQLFIASLDADCCTVPVQLIGYDPESDFTIKNWLVNVWDGALGQDDIVVGSLILAEPGDQLVFFNKVYNVVAKLDDTGMGFDSSIFMNRHAAQVMIADSGRLSADELKHRDDLTSAVMVKLSKDADAQEVAAAIQAEYPQTDAVVSSDFMRDIASRLTDISKLTIGITVLLWVVAVMVLFFVFSIVMDSRKKELGLLIALGATRKKLARIMLLESFVITLLGAICGIFAACLILFPFQTLIAGMLELPYLLPSAQVIFAYMMLSLGVTVAIGPISSLSFIRKLSKTDVYSLIKEND